MADEAVQSVAPVETVTPPVVTETVAAPSQPAVEAPAVVSEAAAPPEAPAQEHSETVLGEALKPVETPKESAHVETQTETPEAKSDEGGQSDNPAPPPKYDAWTLPEGVNLEEARVSEFTNLLSELELEGKASHDVVQKFGQKAVDFYLKEIQNATENLNKFYTEKWEEQKNAWKEATVKDPEIGGNRLQTSVDSALTFIRTHGGTPEQQTEIRQLMDSSGLGNHPAVIRLLANAGRAMSEGRPLAAPKPVSQPKSRTQTLYGVKS